MQDFCDLRGWGGVGWGWGNKKKCLRVVGEEGKGGWVDAERVTGKAAQNRFY